MGSDDVQHRLLDQQLVGVGWKVVTCSFLGWKVVTRGFLDPQLVAVGWKVVTHGFLDPQLVRLSDFHSTPERDLTPPVSPINSESDDETDIEIDYLDNDDDVWHSVTTASFTTYGKLLS